MNISFMLRNVYTETIWYHTLSLCGQRPAVAMDNTHPLMDNIKTERQEHKAWYHVTHFVWDISWSRVTIVALFTTMCNLTREENFCHLIGMRIIKQLILGPITHMLTRQTIVIMKCFIRFYPSVFTSAPINKKIGINVYKLRRRSTYIDKPNLPVMLNP